MMKHDRVDGLRKTVNLPRDINKVRAAVALSRLIGGLYFELPKTLHKTYASLSI